MSAPTPDRAELAERLREMLAEVRRTQRSVATMGFSPESLRDEALARSEGQAEALAAAIAALDAPAPTRSAVESVFERVAEMMCRDGRSRIEHEGDIGHLRPILLQELGVLVE